MYRRETAREEEERIIWERELRLRQEYLSKVRPPASHPLPPSNGRNICPFEEARNIELLWGPSH